MKLERAAICDDAVRALARVRNRTGERWTLPFVLESIQNGRSALFEFSADRHIAWMVVETHEGYELALNVWILEGDPGIANRDEMVRLVDELTKSIGARVWRLESPRRGWGRALRGYITSERFVFERALS